MARRSLFPFMALFLLLSCKKKHTCECSTTITYKSSTSANLNKVTAPGNKVAYNEKMTKKQADAACQHEATAVQSNVTNWETFNGAYVQKPGESVVTTCSIVL